MLLVLDCSQVFIAVVGGRARLLRGEPGVEGADLDGKIEKQQRKHKNSINGSRSLARDNFLTD